MATTAQAKPNKTLFIVLAVVLAAAIVRYAVPSMFGGSTLKTVTPTILPRHFAKAPAGVSGSAPGSVVLRTGRNPFAPPPGR